MNAIALQLKRVSSAALFILLMSIVGMTKAQNISFADENVKALCVDNWDTNNDGELSYTEAAAVTDLGTVFHYQRYITSFDELQYFTGLTAIGSEAFYNCYALASITLPNTVTSIGSEAFYNCYTMTSVSIPSSLSSLGSYAFYGCGALTTIDIGNALTSILGYTFAYCSSLASITIPSSVTSIGSAAFKYCTSLTSITIPSSVTSLGGDTFRNCSALEQIVVESGNTMYDSRNDCNAIIRTSTNKLLVGCKNTVIPNTVTSIDNRAFDECTGLTSIAIPNSVTSIGNYAFNNCTGLTSITISSALTSIGNNAFSYCTGLTSITIPSAVTSIGTNPFVACNNLEQIIVEAGNTVYDSRNDCNAIIKTDNNKLIAGCMNTVIPNTVTSIGEYAFSSFTTLNSINIPNSVTSIGNDAFYRCSGLTSLTIGNGVTSIGNYAFYYCNGLASITVWTNNPPTLGNYAFGAVNKSIPLYVPCNTSVAYQSATGWSEFTNCLEMCQSTIFVLASPAEYGTVTGSGIYQGGNICTVTATPNQGCFFAYWSENGQIVSNEPAYSFVVAGDRTLVANFAMEGDIVFADNNVKAICVANWDTNGDGELSYSEANAVTDLGMTFRNKSSITTFDELQYFTGLTSIASYAFSSCSRMTSIVLPSTVSSLQTCAFSSCLSLTSIVIPNSVTSIEYGAFEDCKALTSISIPNSVVSLGNYVFYGCTGLTSVDIGNSLTSIGSYAFSNCTSLTSITLPNSLISIGIGAFRDCDGLTTMTIPNSVTSIGHSVFNGCDSLGQIVVEAENTVYDSRNNCNAIIITSTNVLIAGCMNTVIPNTVTSIGNSAFSNCTGLTSIDISNSVTSIDNNAFNLCSGLTSVSIGNSLASIGSSAFGHCPALGQITVASDNAVFDSRDNCNAIINTSTNELVVGCMNTIIPNTVASIGSMAFSGCTNLTLIDIPNSVTSIGNNAFYGCTSLADLNIGNSVNTISANAFYGCTSLTSLNIPSSVTSIGDAAFISCYHLNSIVVWAENPPVLGASVFYNVNQEIPLYVPCGFSATYQSAEGWNEFTNCLEMCQGMIIVLANPAEYGTVTGSGIYQGGNTCTVTATPHQGYYFSYWTENDTPVHNEASYSFIVAGNRTLVANFALDGIIPFADDSVKALCVANWDTNSDGELSYAEASAVTDIGTVFRSQRTITSFDELQYFTGLTSIGNYAFYYCNNLTSVVIPNTVTSIGYYAFYHCSGLTSITIPTSVTFLSAYAFSYCNGLTSITIPSAVTSMGSNPFMSCNNLEQIIVEAGNTVYDSRNDCNAIIVTGTNALIVGCKATVIPNTVTSIENYAFSYLTTLTSINIPSSVTSIGDYAIFQCNSLEQIVVEAGNTNYDSRDNCNALIVTSTNALLVGCMNTVIPNTVTSIGNYAFSGCTGLTSITIPNSVTSIGSDAFYYCNLTSITIPNSVTSIGNSAFFYCDDLASMTVLAENPPTLGNSVFYGSTCLIYVPYESLNDYKTATNWSNYESRIFPMSYITIPGHGEIEGNYRFIASPLVDSIAPTTVDNLITEAAYDLYRFSPSDSLGEWQNYKAHTDDFKLVNGQGYLYANENEVNIIFKGEFNEDDTKEVNLVYDANDERKCFNLVGNPFPCNAYLDRDYYVLDENGTGINPNAIPATTPIPPCTAVFVKAVEEGETMVFSRVTR